MGACGCTELGVQSPFHPVPTATPPLKLLGLLRRLPRALLTPGSWPLRMGELFRWRPGRALPTLPTILRSSQQRSGPGSSYSVPKRCRSEPRFRKVADAIHASSLAETSRPGKAPNLPAMPAPTALPIAEPPSVAELPSVAQKPVQPRPSPVFIAPARQSCLNPPATPTCTAPGYYECAISRAPWSLAAGVPLPHKNSPAFLAPGRVIEANAGKSRLRSSVSTSGHGSSSDASAPCKKIDSVRDMTGQLLQAQQKELSPSTFAAEIEGTLDHRIASTVVVPATHRALQRLRDSSPERFWGTDGYRPPAMRNGRFIQAPTLSLKVAAFS